MEAKVIRLIAEVLKIDAKTIGRDTKVSDIEEWDSLMSLMILSRLKEELGVDISIDKALTMESVSDYINCAEGK